MTEARLPGTGPADRRFRLAVVDDLGVVQALTGAAYPLHAVPLDYPLRTHEPDAVALPRWAWVGLMVWKRRRITA